MQEHTALVKQVADALGTLDADVVAVLTPTILQVSRGYPQ
jgi:hypothetical protein